MARRAAMAYDSALPSGKRAEAALGVSDTCVSAMRRQGEGALFDLLAQIVCLSSDPFARPGALVAEASVTLAESLMPQDTADLVRRFWSLLEDEAEAEGAENSITATFARDGDLLALETAMQREVSAQIELIAVVRELRRRKVDPRTWRQS